jgi:hypothetical protein
VGTLQNIRSGYGNSSESFLDFQELIVRHIKTCIREKTKPKAELRGYMLKLLAVDK